MSPPRLCRCIVGFGSASCRLNPDPVLVGWLGCCWCCDQILTGLQFPLTGAVSKTITGGETRKLEPAEQIFAGFMGGAISGLACAPMELVMIQQQRHGGTLIATPGVIMSKNGPFGLFRGLLMSCGREGVFTAGYLGIGPVLGNMLLVGVIPGDWNNKIKRPLAVFYFFGFLSPARTSNCWRLLF